MANLLTSYETDDFTPCDMWPEHQVISDVDWFLYPHIIGNSPQGVRYGLWPLYVEKYRGTDEPDVTLSRTSGKLHNRIIIWTHYGTSVPSKEWNISTNLHAKIGYAEITSTKPYYEEWSSTMRNYRTQWKRDYLGTKYTIEQISLSEFHKAYFKSTTVKRTGRFVLRMLDQRIKEDKTDFELWGVRSISDGSIVAGIAIEYSRSIPCSFYFEGFYLKKASSDRVMIGMIDHCFEQCIKRNVQFLDFGDFWTEGKPKDWKGFSEFKSKFGTKYVYIPPLAYRIELVGLVAKIWRICNTLISFVFGK